LKSSPSLLKPPTAQKISVPLNSVSLNRSVILSGAQRSRRTLLLARAQPAGCPTSDLRTWASPSHNHNGHPRNLRPARPRRPPTLDATSSRCLHHRVRPLPHDATTRPKHPLPAPTRRVSHRALHPPLQNPTDPELYALRAHTDEQSLDFPAAESDWEGLRRPRKDIPAAQLELATTTTAASNPNKRSPPLTAAAVAPSPAHRKILLPQKTTFPGSLRPHPQTSRRSSPRTRITLTTYNAWITRYPPNPAFALPSSTPSSACSVTIRPPPPSPTTSEPSRKTRLPRQSLRPRRVPPRLTAKSPRPLRHQLPPLWPAETRSKLFGMLTAQHQQRAMLVAARTRLAQNPDDLASATASSYLLPAKETSPPPPAPSTSTASAKDSRKAPWTPDELLHHRPPSSTGSASRPDPRYDFALYSTPANSPPPHNPRRSRPQQHRQPPPHRPRPTIDLGSGNLSLLRRHRLRRSRPRLPQRSPLPLAELTSSASEFHDEEQRATPTSAAPKPPSSSPCSTNPSIAAARSIPHATLIPRYAGIWRRHRPPSPR